MASNKILYIDSKHRRDEETAQDFHVDLSILQTDRQFANTEECKCQLVDIAVENIWDLQGCYFTLVEGDALCETGNITETFINLFTDSADKYTPSFSNYLQLYDFLVILKAVLDAKTGWEYTYTISTDGSNIITITSSNETEGTSNFRLKNMSDQMMALLGSSSTNYPTTRSEEVTFENSSCLCIDSISVVTRFMRSNDVYSSANRPEQILCKLYKKNGFRWMEKRISRYYRVSPTNITSFQVRVYDNDGILMRIFPDFSFCLKLSYL